MPRTSEREPGRWHFHRIRVRYGETDQMGVVYHANYINWFEIGRTELIRERGLPYQKIEAAGLLLPVVELESKFQAPAKYDDEVAICTRIAAFTPATIRFESQIRRVGGQAEKEAQPGQPEPVGELLVLGATRHIWLNREWKPVRIDKESPELYTLLKGE